MGRPSTQSHCPGTLRGPGVLAIAHAVHPLVGLMDCFPLLLLGSLGSRIRFQRVVACFVLQLRVTRPPAWGNPALLQSLSYRAPRLLLMAAIGKAALLGQRGYLRES